MTPGLMAADESHLSQLEKWQGSSRGMKGDGGEMRLDRDEPQGVVPGLRVRVMALRESIYTNARSMVNKEEELDAIVRKTNYDIATITEMWWDHSHNWSAAMDGYELFRRDRQLRRGGRMSLYIRECFDAVEIRVGNDKVESLWIRLRGLANKVDILGGGGLSQTAKPG